MTHDDWFDLLWFRIDSTPFTQRPRGRCTGSAASSGCSQEPTEWHLSLHRTQVDKSGMSSVMQSDVVAIATTWASQQHEWGSKAMTFHINPVKGYTDRPWRSTFHLVYFSFRICDHQKLTVKMGLKLFNSEWGNFKFKWRQWIPLYF